jgi:hypothetical protein
VLLGQDPEPVGHAVPQQVHFLDDTRLLRDTLGQLVTGTLAGLFDAPTTFTVDWTAPIQSLSLSALDGLGDYAVGTALLCLNSWGRGLREAGQPGELRIVVRDESWKQLRLGPDAVKAFDADLRLSRSTGDLQVAVAHKPSDLLTAGDTGSQAVAIAKDLLHLTDIKILHGQDPAVADDLDRRPRPWLRSPGPGRPVGDGRHRARRLVRRRPALPGPDRAAPGRTRPRRHQPDPPQPASRASVTRWLWMVPQTKTIRRRGGRGPTWDRLDRTCTAA